MATSYYQFGKTTFTNFVFVKQGAYFSDPEALDVESITPGAYYLEISSSSGPRYKYHKTNPRGGWTSFYFNGHGIDDKGQSIPRLRGNFRFRLVNTAPGTRQVLQGSLSYG